MKFLFVLYVESGCDYTVGCGVRVFPIDANSPQEALEKAKVEIYENIGCPCEAKAENLPQYLKYYCVTDEVEVDVKAINKEMSLVKEKYRLEQALAAAEKLLADTKSKIEKLKQTK